MPRNTPSPPLALVILVSRRLDNLDQTVKALKDNLMRGGIINLSCRGTGALGVNKRVGLGITNRLGKRERLLKVFLGLAREACIRGFFPSSPEKV